MFKFLKTLFAGDGGSNGIKDKTEMNARIVETTPGYFVLFNSGSPVGTYSRARDARRGALRRGLTLA